MLIRVDVTENTKLLCYLSSSVVGDRIFIPSDVILQCSRAVPLLSSTSFSPCFDIAAVFCRSQVLFLIAGIFLQDCLQNDLLMYLKDSCN